MTCDARGGPVSYVAEVHAEGPVYGTGQTAHTLLGMFWSISPKLALRWLRGEAVRIADRLDPDPERAGWAGLWLRVDPVPVSDCPAELRVWAGDPEVRRAASGRLRCGVPVVLAVQDGGCRFTLAVWPVTADLASCLPMDSPPVPVWVPRARGTPYGTAVGAGPY